MCTRIFWSDNPVAKVVSRTMDWAVSDEPDLWSLPAGLERSGGDGPSATGWTSRHSSVVLSMWRSGTVDGINQHGLAAHALYLDGAGTEPADDRPTVTTTVWVQYVLDNFATVAEAVAGMRGVRVVSEPIRGHHLGAHYAIEDASGDSAIFEPIDGRMVVHHGHEFTVMANSPVLDQQLANLRRYRPFGGELAPPGDITSLDRFVRASYFLHYLPEPEDSRQAVAGVLHLASNASVPPGAPYEDGGVYPTWWLSAADLTNRVYYVWSAHNPGLLWVDLASVGSPDTVTALDPSAPAAIGDASAWLEPATLPY